MKPTDLLRENIKKNKVGQIIETQSPAWPKPEFGSNRCYHTLTRGWICNEIFRRLDPQGRTIGEFVQEEISIPLGGGINIGEPLTNIQDLSGPSIFEVLIGSLLPNYFSPQIEVILIDFIILRKMGTTLNIYDTKTFFS